MFTTKIRVVDNEFYIAWCYPEERLIHHRFKQFCSGDDFRKSLTMAVEAFETYNCRKWLSDDRDFTGSLAPDDWNWGETNFVDRTVAAGWKYSAMVMPASALAKISTMSLVCYFSSKGVEAKYFVDIEKAEAWIRSK